MTDINYYLNKIVYGLKINYKSNMLFQLLFLPDFNKEQIISMMNDLYSNLHTSNEYSFEFLFGDGIWKEIDKEIFRKFLIVEDDQENIFEIGFIN